MNIFKGFHGLSIRSAPPSVSNGGIARRVMHEKKNKKINKKIALIMDNGGL